MRRFTILGALALAGPSLAADIDGGLYTGLVVPGPNHELYEPAALFKPLSPGPALGARLSVRPIRLLAAEVEAHGAAASVRDAGAGLVYAYRGQLLVLPPLSLPADLEPFVTGGFGNIGIRSPADALGADVDWAAHAGIGAKLPLKGELSLRADVRMLFADRNYDIGSLGGHTEALIGLSYRLGPPRDSDGDGLADRKDACADQAEVVNGYADDDGCPDALADLVVEIRDDDDLPVPDVAVLRDGQEVGRTDAAGRLTLSGLMPATSVVLGGQHAQMDPGETATVALAEGDNQARLQMSWKPGRVRIVTRAAGAPLVGAKARFTGPKAVPASEVADGDQLFHLAPGEWRILVAAESYGTELVDLSIGPDERSVVVVELALEPARVEVTREEVKILQQILFEHGSADIQGASLDLVKEVTATILSHPHLKRIQIQGHTDSVGPADVNRKLSQSRVESVMRYLIERGVPAEKLEAKGFGEDEPIASNATEAGRAQNRRVVFLILEQDQAP